MDGVADELIQTAASMMSGHCKRLFIGMVCRELCDGSARKTEERFGWGRETVRKGLDEQDGKETCEPRAENRGKQRFEERNPQLAIDIRLIVEPHTHTDPELKTERMYSNVSAAEVRDALIERGYSGDNLPSERTLRDILNRMQYRLKRIQKGKPLKKTKDTDAVFENVKSVREKYEDDPETLLISMDTKSKVSLGEYALGGKNTD